MTLSEQKRKQIMSLVGQDGLSRILDAQERASKDSEVIKATGVAYKSPDASIMRDLEATGLTVKNLEWIESKLGTEAVARVLKTGSREKALAEISRLAAAQGRRKSKAQPHTNTVRISASDTPYSTVYKRIVDDAARPRGGGGVAAVVEQRTPIIEDQTERLAWYQGRLGLTDQLHFYMLQLLGVDKTEDVYRLAEFNVRSVFTPTPTKARKALSGAELDQLDDQRLNAMGVPESVILALGTLLKGSAYTDFITRLMRVFEFDQQTKPKSSDTQTAIDPFWKIRVRI